MNAAIKSLSRASIKSCTSNSSVRYYSKRLGQEETTSFKRMVMINEMKIKMERQASQISIHKNTASVVLTPSAPKTAQTVVLNK